VSVESCVFCRIVSGQAPARRVFEDDQVVAFQDINPQAPTHLLVIPRQHIASVAHATEEHEQLLGHLQLVGARLAREAGLKVGYRAVINTGPEAGQTVFHIHLHVIGGRPMRWPPG
jgi:histidine triad (HIT) family protein